MAVFWTKRSGLCFGLNNKPMVIQGWMELAGARYSMGASRVNTALLNLHKVGYDMYIFTIEPFCENVMYRGCLFKLICGLIRFRLIFHKAPIFQLILRLISLSYHNKLI